MARTGLFKAPQGDLSCSIGLRAAASLDVNLPASTSLIATLKHLPDFGTHGTPARADTNISIRLGFLF
ncbi:MAG: hypothetical protein MO846_06080 [Candidatus Devosia symbiotica]|nr:hypothetical protein [Candidatus Devosia symbiotica]